MIRKLCKEKSSEGSPSGYANWVKFKKKTKTQNYWEFICKTIPRVHTRNKLHTTREEQITDYSYIPQRAHGL
jgi:hypothetical protein